MDVLNVGDWVQQGENKGQIQELYRDVARVKWLSKTEEWRHVQSVGVLTGGLVRIDEPHLTREEAAAYSGITPAGLYFLNGRNCFGGKKSLPLRLRPSELDEYLSFRQQRLARRKVKEVVGQ